MIRFIIRRRSYDGHIDMRDEAFYTIDCDVPALEAKLGNGGSGPYGFTIHELIGAELMDRAAKEELDRVGVNEFAASAPTLGEENTDDIAVDSFARAMKSKMAEARAKGRSGWEGCDPADLSRMLREHVEKGDPSDVANFCMMLWHHSAQIAPQPQAAEPKGLTEEQIKKLANTNLFDAGTGAVNYRTIIKFARALLSNGGE